MIMRPFPQVFIDRPAHFAAHLQAKGLFFEVVIPALTGIILGWDNEDMWRFWSTGIGKTQGMKFHVLLSFCISFLKCREISFELPLHCSFIAAVEEGLALCIDLLGSRTTACAFGNQFKVISFG